MAKITLNDLQSMNDLTELNDNFTQIEDEFQSRVLYRDNPTGEPNQMEQDLDMNSYRILNLPKPANNSEAARLLDVQNALAGGDANLITYNDENVQTALDKRTIYVGSVAEDISGLTVIDGQNYEILGFDGPDGVGAQSLIGNASALKSLHGISGWSPTVPPVSAQAGANRAERVANYLAGAGETDPGGSGLFVRKNKKIYNICEYGAVPGSTEPVDASLEATTYGAIDGATIVGDPGEYTISQAVTYIGRFIDDSIGKSTTVDFSGVKLISETDQATRFLVNGKTKFTGAVLDKVHVFLDPGSDESEVSGCELLNQNNHFIRTETNKCTIAKNIFKSSGSAAAFFNCISVTENASGTRIYGNDFNYTAGGAINVDATSGSITEDTLILGNRFFCNGLKEPSNALKIEATNRVVFADNILDGNNRSGAQAIFLVGSVSGEPAPGGNRRILIESNIFKSYGTTLFNVSSSSTYTGNSNYNTDIVFSGNTIEDCDFGIRRLQGNINIINNIFRDNVVDIDASESSNPNGNATIFGNQFWNSGGASIYTGNLTDNASVSVPELRIEQNLFRGWNSANGAGRENVCAIYQRRNAFDGSATATTKPSVIIKGNTFNTATGNEVNCIAIEEAFVTIKDNRAGGTISLDRPVLLHPQDSGSFYIPEPVVYEDNDWQLVSAIPSIGKHLVGEILKNNSPSAGGYQYWVCVTEGDFDTTSADPVFKQMGAIAA